jgi:hypothetical protein
MLPTLHSFAACSACGASTGHDHSGGTGLIEVMSKSSSPPLPVTVTQLPVTRCQICHRIVAAYRASNLKWGPDRALPPGPSRSIRPPLSVPGGGSHITPQVQSLASIGPRTTSPGLGGTPVVTAARRWKVGCEIGMRQPDVVVLLLDVLPSLGVLAGED